jgi:hypothetical protein
MSDCNDRLNCDVVQKLVTMLEQEVDLLKQKLAVCAILSQNAMVTPFVDYELIEGWSPAYCLEYVAVRKVVMALLECRAENQRLQYRLDRAEGQLGNLKGRR